MVASVQSHFETGGADLADEWQDSILGQTDVPEFLRNLDLVAFAQDVARLRRELRAAVGPADFAHLRKVERWGKTCTAPGYATAGIVPNLLSAALIAQGRSVRWMIGHHVLHRCYDRIPGVPARYTSSVFAKGWRRYVDWFDWWYPEAWVHHHTRHHNNLGDEFDTDTVERPPVSSRGARAAIVAFYALTWEWFYLSFYSLHQLRRYEDRQRQRKKTDRDQGDADDCGPLATPASRSRPYKIGLRDYVDLTNPHVREVYRRCLLPFGLAHFVVLPLFYAPLGPWAVFSVCANTVLADLLLNLHGFALNRTSHAGDDLYQFTGKPKTRGEYYLRQILGTANHASGGDWLDFVQTWTNYHVEHHLWPDLPLKKYQEAQPKLRALCLKYGIPYVQETVWTRLERLFQISIGGQDMPVISTNVHKRPRSESVPRAPRRRITQ